MFQNVVDMIWASVQRIATHVTLRVKCELWEFGSPPAFLSNHISLQIRKLTNGWLVFAWCNPQLLMRIPPMKGIKMGKQIIIVINISRCLLESGVPRVQLLNKCGTCLPFSISWLWSGHSKPFQMLHPFCEGLKFAPEAGNPRGSALLVRGRKWLVPPLLHLFTQLASLRLLHRVHEPGRKSGEGGSERSKIMQNIHTLHWHYMYLAFSLR